MKYEVAYSQTVFDDLQSAEQELARCIKKFIGIRNNLYRIVNSADMVMSKHDIKETEVLIKKVFGRTVQLVTGSMKSILDENFEVFIEHLSTAEDCVKDFDYITCEGKVRSLTFIQPTKLPRGLAITYQVGATTYPDYKEALAAELNGTSKSMRCYVAESFVLNGYVYIAVLSGKEESARFIASELLGDGKCNLGIKDMDYLWTLKRVDASPVITNPVVDYLSGERSFGVTRQGNLFIVDDTYGLEPHRDNYFALVERYGGKTA